MKRTFHPSIALITLLGRITDCQAFCPYMLSPQSSGGHPANSASCPMSSSYIDQEDAHHVHNRRLAHFDRVGDWGEPEEGYAAVRDDIALALTDSKDFWPADYEAPHGPNYGGLMIRLAWHCAGSYRKSDGRGGCDGGRIRFAPELDWPDNGNLDKALEILKPIKEKYGSKLSWGDLIILAGNTAIETMGGPVLGFCGGRIDDPNGDNSLILGPNELQEELTPCETQGTCQFPLGPTVIGNIYVEPDGKYGSKGDPVESQADVAEVFSRMGFTDEETVSLIGGGHAFGKAHGACAMPPCGEGELAGKGPNTFTSGFDGQWTLTPTSWSNTFFHNLFDQSLNWTLAEGPGGKVQFFPGNSGSPKIMMLVSDLALAEGEYRPISESYRDDMNLLQHDFMHAWYHLTSADMGPVSRCIGSEVPAVQDFQNPLPEVPAGYEKIDFVAVRSAIQALIDEDVANIGHFANLAFRSASTYRATDYKGGANGARIRFAPEKDWEVNEGTAEALALLEPIKKSFPAISYADLIVLAGQTSVEAAGGNAMNFCAGRVDAPDGSGSVDLAPRVYSPAVVSVRDNNNVRGLTPEEGVALFALPGSDGILSNQYFSNLKAGPGPKTDEELALLEPEFSAIVDSFIADNDEFLRMFESAWHHMMTADRYDGPLTNYCAGKKTNTLEGEQVDMPNIPTQAPTASAASLAASIYFPFSAAIFVTIASML